MDLLEVGSVRNATTGKSEVHEARQTQRGTNPMNYIRLTECGSLRRIWVNLDHITALEVNEIGGATTTVALTSKSGYDVIESAEHILRAIEDLGDR
jgi:hypothetical protein